MIVIYTGDGKGKTSASIGQIIRALGHGYTVAFGQFMKRDDKAGEQKIIKQLIDHVHIAGPGFFRKEEEIPKQRECAQKLLTWASKTLEEVDILILDEALYALSYGIISQEELQGLISKARALDKDLILSGRGLTNWLKEEADLISEIQPVKHPFERGIAAKAGIDF